MQQRLSINAFMNYYLNVSFNISSGIKVGGSFIVTIWSFMTFKWGMFLFFHGKNYKKELLKERRGLLGSIQA